MKKTSIVSTNLDSFLNDLSDDDDSVGGGGPGLGAVGGGGGLDAGRGVVSLPGGKSPLGGRGRSTRGGGGGGANSNYEDEGYDEDFDA